MTDETPRCSRRRALAGGAALASTALSTASAGCLSLLPPVGQQIRYGRVDVPEPVGEPQYRRWIPTPQVVPDAEFAERAPSWSSITPGRLGASELGASYGLGRGLALATFEYVGYDFEYYDYVHSISPLGVVAEGDIDASAVTETLLAGGYSRDGTHHGWELFDRTDIPRTVAVSESAVVLSRGDKRRTHIEAILDAGGGRIDRYHETEESYATFSERVGAQPTVLYGFADGFTPVEPEHSAMVYTFDEDGAYLVYHSQYAEGNTPSSDEIQQYLDEDSEVLGQAYAVDIQTDDRHAEVQLRIEASKFRDSNTDERPPHVMWGVEDTDETVTIRLEAGDTISIDQLDIGPESALVTDLEGGTVLEPGDELRFDVEAFPESDTTVSLVYSVAGSENATALLHYTPEELDTE
jgi:hypothetical protein